MTGGVFKRILALEKTGTQFEYTFIENDQLNELPDTTNNINQKARDVLNKLDVLKLLILVE
jgi:hypothetical protein